MTLEEIKNPKWTKFDIDDEYTYPKIDDLGLFSNSYWVTVKSVESNHTYISQATFTYVNNKHQPKWYCDYDSGSIDGDVVLAYTEVIDTTPNLYVGE